MARDDQIDKELHQLEEEIEAKVDSLFVEMEGALEEKEGSEEDPWKDLREYFYTLEWEIDAETLEKIASEVARLKTRFLEGPFAELLDWLAQVTERIRARASDVDQESMKVFHEIKEGLLKLVDDPKMDPTSILDPLRERVTAYLEALEEAPTITVDLAQEEEIFMEELDRAVDDAIREYEEPGTVERETPAPAFEGPSLEAGLEETTVQEESDLRVETEETTGVDQPQEPVQPTPPPLEEPFEGPGIEGPEVASAEEDPLSQARGTMKEGMDRIEAAVREFQELQDPLGLESAIKEAGQKLRSLVDTLLEGLDAIRWGLTSLQDVQIAPPSEPQEEPEGPAEQDLLFVSVSNRILGIPMDRVRGVYRVPSRVSAQIRRWPTANLAGRVVPLVPLGRKLGLEKLLELAPKQEKRIILVQKDSEEVGLLVDRVVARQVVPMEIGKGESPPILGRVRMEKEASVLNVDAL